MTHSEAVKDMAAERYLLDELQPDARDAFEEHMFDCPECALDVRSGAAFIGEAKAQLPELSLGSRAAKIPSIPRKEETGWFGWLRPVFAVPVMAALLIVVGYQNVVTFPTLRHDLNEPHVVQVAPLYGATRGGTHTTIHADRSSGIALPVEVDSAGSYSSFAIELMDPTGKTVWTSTAPAQNAGGDAQFSVVLPGGMLQNGTYTLVVSGVDSKGTRAPAGRYVFDVVLSK